MYTFDAVGSFRVSAPSDTYIYDIVPFDGGLAAISSDNCLRFLDPRALDEEPKYAVPKINADITCLRTIPPNSGSGELVCTAGRDGRVCIVDPRNRSQAGEIRVGTLNLSEVL